MYKSKAHEEKVKMLVEREVIYNQGLLVEALIKNGWEGNEPRIDWDTDIVNMHLTEEEAKNLGFDSLEDAQDNGQDTKEVFEWWLVTDWLAQILERLGCVVIKSDYANWWGRTETGQGLTMDCDLNGVADHLIKKYGY